ncbi:MAG: hypothetical protein PHN35_05490, partial [Clostridia bacterium]|nr:hypothetical protein [Clostridia bacterium]
MNRVRKFFSRRNKVYLITDGAKQLIYKQYTDAKACAREKANLELLASCGLAVPQIEGEADKALLLSYINGMTYEQVLRKYEQGFLNNEQAAAAFTALIKWLEKYFAATKGALRGDVNLRNFIYLPDQTCVGIDFEDTLIYGDMCKDIGRILAFIATYEPPFSDKKLLLCSHILSLSDINSPFYGTDCRNIIAIAYRAGI